MHNGMLAAAGEKMAKSVGNLVTLRDAIDRWGRETVLLYFMTGHWSKPLDFSEEAMEQARAQLETFRDALLEDRSADADEGELAAALEDDFNTPEALAILHRWRSVGANEQLRRALGLFGIEAERPEAPAELVRLGEERTRARKAGDYATADAVRQKIEAEGWEIRDRADGFDLVPK
jgi:cysteinyl-tRNA synthetase